MSSAGPAKAPFDEWGRLTRFLESARLAFARERNLWTSLEISDPTGVEVAAPAGQGKYRVSLNNHVAALDDSEMLFASVLLHSYALAESVAADHLGKSTQDFGGIEDWGARLLATTNTNWSQVAGGLQRAVELAVVRNAFAHGSRTIDKTQANRLKKAGVSGLGVGSKVGLSYTNLRDYRACLRSLLRLSGVGA